MAESPAGVVFGVFLALAVRVSVAMSPILSRVTKDASHAVVQFAEEGRPGENHGRAGQMIGKHHLAIPCVTIRAYNGLRILVLNPKGGDMRALFVPVAVLLFLGVAAPSGSPKKLSLDNPSDLGLKIQSDPSVKTEGSSSIKIITQWPTTVCLGVVEGMPIEDAALMYRAKVKSDLDGTAYLEMWVQIAGGQYFSKGMNDVVSQRTDWKTLQTPFNFQKGQSPEKITLNLVINGKGTVWVDDVVLSVESLK